jgi:peptidoglycan/xylan/chitin deacetylase (PgdA/CDA1 family)
MTFRDLAKAAVLRSGGFRALHRMRNRECLTVVMFHRVLPESIMAQVDPDPTYSLSTELFSGIVDFLRDHYALVGLDDVIASRDGRQPLPHCAAMITFDDGWQDNLDHAMPILKAANLPWTLFVAKDAVAEPSCWWQESLLWSLRTRRAEYEALWRLAGDDDAVGKKSELDLLARYARLSPERRQHLLKSLRAELEAHYRTAQMLSEDGLRTLHANGVRIGTHGSAHLPLSAMDDPKEDIRAARSWLEKCLPEPPVAAMSFPHGRYDDRSTAAARALGYRLLFTSDAVLNACPDGWLMSDLVGRISIAAHDVEDARGQLAHYRLAPWLFLRDRQTIGVPFSGRA